MRSCKLWLGSTATAPRQHVSCSTPSPRSSSTASTTNSRQSCQRGVCWTRVLTQLCPNGLRSFARTLAHITHWNKHMRMRSTAVPLRAWPKGRSCLRKSFLNRRMEMLVLRMPRGKVLWRWEEHLLESCSGRPARVHNIRQGRITWAGLSPRGARYCSDPGLWPTDDTGHRRHQLESET